MPNNNKPLETEKTMIKRFINNMEHSSHTNTQYESDLQTFFPETSSGSANQIMPTNMALSKQVVTAEIPYDNDIVNPLGVTTEHALTTGLVEELTKTYTKIIRDYRIVHVSHLCHRFARVKLAGVLYPSKKARTDRNSYICAYWLGNDNISIDTATLCRPGCVQYYIRHNVILKSNMESPSVQMYLAYVTWYMPHPEKNYIVYPNTLWSPDTTPESEASFRPISRIVCRCMQGELPMTFQERPYNNGTVIVINPISCANFKIFKKRVA